MAYTSPAPTRPTPLRHAPVVGLALVVAALATIVWWQDREIRRLSLAAAARPTVTWRNARARSVALDLRRVAASPTDRAPAEDAIARPALLAPLRAAKPAAASAGALARLLDSPEFFQLLALHRQASLDARFAGLFRQLGLNPEELAAFKRLLAEKENVALEVVAVNETQPDGPLPPATLAAGVSAARAEVEAAIRQSLGGERYALYREYEQALPQRTIVAQLEQRLSYSATPLTPTQADALVRILATHAPVTPATDVVPASSVVVNNKPAAAPALLQPETLIAQVTETAIVQSHAVLAPAQVSALRDIQNEQQASARAMQLLRDSLPVGDHRLGPAFQILLQ
jgi:hypothetical protein